MKTVSIKFVAKPNGMSTIYLVYSKAITLPDGSRKKSESLKIEIYTIPKNTKEKKYNDKILEVAEYVRCNRQLEVIRGVYGLKNIDKMEDSFLDYIDEKIDRCQSDKYNGIKQCLKNSFNKTIRFKDINVNLCEEFRVYLNGLVNEGRYSSNTVTSYFNKFLNLITSAYNENIIPYDYCKKVPKMKWEEPIKDYLTEQEVRKLLSTPYPNKVFKRGVEFTLNTGLRHSDILDLKHSHIKYQGDGNIILSKVIVKTGKTLIIPLNDAAVNLISKKGEGQVFKGFPDNNRANKMLKEWLKKAKISKALTFHGLRHTFAMTAVGRGIDIYALKELMGHASIENTLIYAKMLPSKLVSEIKKLD
jgi:integrase